MKKFLVLLMLSLVGLTFVQAEEDEDKKEFEAFLDFIQAHTDGIDPETGRLNVEALPAIDEAIARVDAANIEKILNKAQDASDQFSDQVEELAEPLKRLGALFALYDTECVQLRELLLAKPQGKKLKKHFGALRRKLAKKHAETIAEFLKLMLEIRAKYQKLTEEFESEDAALSSLFELKLFIISKELNDEKKVIGLHATQAYNLSGKTGYLKLYLDIKD